MLPINLFTKSTNCCPKLGGFVAEGPAVPRILSGLSPGNLLSEVEVKRVEFVWVSITRPVVRSVVITVSLRTRPAAVSSYVVCVILVWVIFVSVTRPVVGSLTICVVVVINPLSVFTYVVVVCPFWLIPTLVSGVVACLVAGVGEGPRPIVLPASLIALLT